MSPWSIPTERLDGPRSRGGAALVGGTRYQEAYAILQLVNLLNGRDGLVRVRYEGVEDVDLLYSDGAERYVQLKNEPRARYTIPALRPILQEFAVDLLEAGDSANLRLRLVARSDERDEAVERLVTGAPSDRDRKGIAEALGYGTESARVPKRLVPLDAAALTALAQRLLPPALAQRLLPRLEFEFGGGEDEDGIPLFEFIARSRLEGRGIVDAQFQRQAISVLRSALRPRAEFSAADVERLVSRFVQRTALERFAGKVELLTDGQLPAPANEQRVRSYYEGHPAAWDVVSANADVERTQSAAILNRITEPHEGARLVCLVGHPGSGKSTILLRIAWDVWLRRHMPVLRIRSNRDESVWDQLEAFYNDVRRPLLVLVEDLFRRPGVAQRVDDINPALPVTILTSAWPGECHRERMKLPIELIEVQAIDDAERRRALARFNKRLIELTTEQRLYFETANSFLVLMNVLSTGKGLRAHYEEVLSWLRVQDEVVYRAYEYICFAFQYDVSFPEPLLERLDHAGSFHRILSRDAARGVLFEADVPEQIRAAHVIVAREVIAIYGRSPVHLLNEISSVVEPMDGRHRRFLAYLLRALALQTRLALALLPRTTSKIADCINAAPISELGIWHAYYRFVGLEDDARHVADAALKRGPANSGEWATVMGMMQKRDVVRSLLPAMHSWIGGHFEDRSAVRLYLRLVAEHDLDGLPPLLDRFWQTALPDAPDEVVFALRLLNRYTSWKRKKQRSYAFVAAKQSLVRQIVSSTLAWAEQHVATEDIWRALLGIVGLLPHDDLRHRTLVTILGRRLSEPSTIRQAVRLFGISESTDAVRQLYGEHFASAQVEQKLAFAMGLRATVHLEEARRIYEVILAEEPSSLLARFNYGDVLLKLREYHKAADELEIVFRAQPDRENIRARLAEVNAMLARQARGVGNNDEATQYMARAEVYLAAAAEFLPRDGRKRKRTKARLEAIRRKRIR